MAAALHVTSDTISRDELATAPLRRPPEFGRTTPTLEQHVKLGIDGFHYRDLYDNQRLGDLTIAFDRYVERNDAALFGRFDGYRFAMQSGIAHGGLNEPEESALL